jgi:hypothetical protein
MKIGYSVHMKKSVALCGLMIFFSGVAIVSAWTGPTAVAPGNNAPAPINVGAVDQVKNAGLSVNTLLVAGNMLTAGTYLDLAGTNAYLNFGASTGNAGYGIRDNAGSIEVKNSGGVWTSITGGGGASYINNQFSSGQAANFWMTGTGKAGEFDANLIKATSGSGGNATLNQGGASNAGYLAWFKTDGVTRMAYMGWDPTNVTLNLENGSNFLVTNGNVGIGSGAFLGYKFSVTRAAGAAATGEMLTSDGTQWIMTNSNAAASAYNPLVQASDHSLIYSNGVADTGGLVIGPWSGSTKGLRIDSSGNLGIGVVAPTQKLDVAGNAQISGDFFIGGNDVIRRDGSNAYLFPFSTGYPTNVVYIGGGAATNLNVIGNVYGNGYYYNSDRRLKKNIEPMTDNLAKVLKLEPVTYNWKNPQFATTTQLGFIAQDVKAIVPELVNTDASTTMEAVDYARVTPILVGAVQELNQKISDQQKEIDTLKKEIESIKNK